MTREEAFFILEDWVEYGGYRIADLYDHNQSIASALDTLIPNFEYPDWSHLTVKETLEKIYGLALLRTVADAQRLDPPPHHTDTDA